MSDRELLEMAAKAAGENLTVWSDKITDYDSHHYGKPALHGSGAGGQCNSWNPLIDDGDALRLAVKLMLTVSQSPFGVEARVLGSIQSFEGWGDDRPEATRRAIVSAAAAIGRSMP